MRLADAIVLGFVFPDGWECALNRANQAVGTQLKWDKAAENWPWLSEPAEIPCGCSGIRGFGTFGLPHHSALSIIVHLFDFHIADNMRAKWTLEQLCDWVEQQDPTPRPVEAAADAQVNVEVCV